MQTLRWRILYKNWAQRYYAKTDLKGIVPKLSWRVLCKNWTEGYYAKNWAEKYSATTELNGIMQKLSWKVLCSNWAEGYGVLRKTWAEWYYAKPEVKGRPIEPNSDADGYSLITEHTARPFVYPSPRVILRAQQGNGNQPVRNPNPHQPSLALMSTNKGSCQTGPWNINCVSAGHRVRSCFR